MNIVGKTEDQILKDRIADYGLAKKLLIKDVEKHLVSDRAKFALKVLAMDHPIQYLEAVVRYEIADQTSDNSLKK